LATAGGLEQVLDNLVANALDVSPRGSTVTVRPDHVPPTIDLGRVGDEHVDRHRRGDGASQASHELVPSGPVHFWKHDQHVDVGIGPVLASSDGAEEDHLGRVRTPPRDRR
jgi:K+-sensing histidine kinase KdpD